MSIIPQLKHLDTIIQSGTLRRFLHDQLYSHHLYRGEAIAEEWDAKVGDSITETRGSDLGSRRTPLKPGEDPASQREKYEQWTITCAQYAGSTDTNMPASRAAAINKFSRDAKSIAASAGKTLNLVHRNQLFRPYLAGTTIADNADTGVTVEVGSINGFTHVLVDGVETSVSANAKKPITIGGVAANVIAAAASDPDFPLGHGTLTLESSTTWVAGAVVKADDATRQIYAGGGASVDSIGPSNILRLEDIQTGLAYLQASDVPPHEDGLYHIHVDPLVLSGLYTDNQFQRINEGGYDNEPYADFIVRKLLGCYFYRNSQSPNLDNSSGENNVYQSSRPTNAPNALLGSDISAELRNKDGVAIARTIITGGGSSYEKFVPEDQYITEAGVTGESGGFAEVSMNGIAAMLDNVRYTIRAPLDKLQQVVSQSWSWTGDHGIPSDKFGGRGKARYKRAIVINSGIAG